MLKKCTKYISMILIALCLFPWIQVDASSTMTVRNQEELKSALENADISTIVLGNDIETTEKINVMRPVTIDGNGHTMQYVGTFGDSDSSDNTIWSGIYVLQVYKTEATIRNIALTGGNGGLLINGAKVQLEGTIDLSGNGFGGIELGQGSGVESIAHVILTDQTTLVNRTDSEDRPTLWVPKDSTGSILEINEAQYELLPEEEFTLNEIEAFTISTENPETGDPIILYISGMFLCFSVALFAFYKLSKREKDYFL